MKGLGARVIEIEAPFDPEGGAYAGDGHAHAPAAIRTATRHAWRCRRTITATIIMMASIT